MKSKRIIGFTLLFVMLFLLIGLNTASASNDDVLNNLSDSLESSPVSSMDLGASDSIDSDVELGSSDSIDSNADLGISEDIESDVISSDEILKENADSEIIGDDGKTVHTITENDYSNYFDSDGNLINSLVKANDTINLSGNFSNK